jgi:magnesium transporter
VSLPGIQCDASQVVIPTQFVLFNLSAILGSAILYGDFRTAKFHQFVTFMYGCAATFAGVWIIAWVPTPNEPSTGPDDLGGAISDTEMEDHGLLVPDDVPAGGVSRKRGNTPVLESRRSTVSLMGISPAQV